MQLCILGAAAGGGLPQWNCGCSNCCAARNGQIPAQTQSSVAVSADGENWALLNASPDIRHQLASTQQLAPKTLRDSPLRSVLLTNGDIDHIAGLLTLREVQPFHLFATSEIHAALADNPIFDALRAHVVTRKTVVLGEPFELVSGLTATCFAVPGKVPLYLEGETVQTDLEGEQTIGVELVSGSTRTYYIPGCSKLTNALKTRLDGADLLLFDGTLWSDDEMIQSGTGQKTGQRMGHMSMSGEMGSMVAFNDLNLKQKAYIHMNNTNPVLNPKSSQRQTVEASGWIVGQDGMEFSL